jgi:hypothetical protein
MFLVVSFNASVLSVLKNSLDLNSLLDHKVERIVHGILEGD